MNSDNNSMEEKFSQSENQETGGASQDNNHASSQFDILDFFLTEYIEKQSYVTKSCQLLSEDPLQSSVTSLIEVPKDQTREQEEELKNRKKEPKGKKRPRENELQCLDVNISKKIGLSNTQDKDISEKANDKVTGGMIKNMQQIHNQHDNQEYWGMFHFNNCFPMPFPTLNSPFLEYFEESEEEKQNLVAGNSRSLPSPFLINEEQEIDGEVHVSFQEELSPEGERTRSSESPGPKLAENACISRFLKSDIPESMTLPPFWNFLLPTKMSSIESRIQPQSKKKEVMVKSADETSVLSPNDTSPLKEIFQNLGGSDKFDAMMRGEFVLDINETDFLPETPDSNRPINEDEEQKEENMETSNDQKVMKIRHKFSKYQLGILKEHFHQNEYIHPKEVQFLSKALNLTPQQIQHWFRNQRSKRNKCADSLKGTSDVQAAAGIPTRSMNNSSPWKEIFQNLEGLDRITGGDGIFNPEKNDFLPQTLAGTRSKNEDEKIKAENIEASDHKEEKKIRHKLSEYQLQTLKEYFHRSEYLKADEVQVLSKELSLPPQKIRFWFGNQRAKKKKCAGSFNRP